MSSGAGVKRPRPTEAQDIPTEEEDALARTHAPRNALPVISYDPYLDEEHKEMDELVFQHNIPYHQPGEQWTLLSHAVLGCQTLNRKYASREDAQAILNENHLLLHELDLAWDTKSLKSIRNKAILQKPNKFVTNDTRLIDARVKGFENRFEEQIRSYILNPPKFGIYDESMIQLPDLLLHDLGEWSKPNGHLSTAVNECFRKKEATYIFNTAGSGKTRLVLEGLCRFWGFYFTAAYDDVSHHGSSDLFSSLTRLSHLEGFTTEIPTWDRASGQPFDEKYITRNVKLATPCFKRVWLARLIVFDLFYRLTSVKKRRAHRLRWLWVILQVKSEECVGADIFKELTDILQIVDEYTLDPMILQYKTTFEKLLTKDEKFYVVIDEAQYAAGLHPKAFLSENYTKHRPVLRQLTITWALQFPGHFVVCGTGLSVDVIIEALASNYVKEPKRCRTFSSLGAFDTREAQEKYMLRYIPQEQYEPLTTSFAALLERAWRWLRGRHRITVQFVALLLFNKQKSPHRLLNAYVAQMTGFTPTDGCNIVNEEELLSPKIMTLIEKLQRLDFEKLNEPRFESLKDEIFGIMLQYRFTKDFMRPKSQHLDSVELGFAHISEDAQGPRIDEPLILLAAADFFKLDAKRVDSIEMYFRAPNGAAENGRKGYEMEELIAWTFHNLFDGSRPLAQIFRWVGESPEWANGNARLVTRVKRPCSGEWDICRADLTSGTSPLIGVKAKTIIDTMKWFEEASDGIPFCFPDHMCGPDVVFLAEVGEEIVWVLVQSKFNQKKTLSETEHLEAGRSVIPESMYVHRNGNYKTTARPKLVDDLQLALARANAKYLRVIASWPARPTNKHLQKVVHQSNHPLAWFDLDCVTQRSSRVGYSCDALRPVPVLP
ncbi:hypothetical protein BD410DRAFT_783559 [Rickenella mellea]|uniref:Uncharacterized protein n=1 Tax=Rickenella mellea TaxID=50990 RepID=A0A4Y7QI22_9AGAM|nr:hypothetical protein BD410DRAFT_783559 [Rickenella mellea]